MAKEFCDNTRNNWLSGLSVAIVSIPISAGFTYASGVNPLMGLKTAIYSPLIAGLLGGSSTNIIGPTAALLNIQQ